MYMYIRKEIVHKHWWEVVFGCHPMFKLIGNAEFVLER